MVSDVRAGHEVQTQVIELVDDETEEEALRKIFASGGTSSAQQQSEPPRYIELRLGKRLTVQPEEERSLSIALRQQLLTNKKYNLSRHFDFYARLGFQL